MKRRVCEIAEKLIYWTDKNKKIKSVVLSNR